MTWNSTISSPFTTFNHYPMELSSDWLNTHNESLARISLVMFWQKGLNWNYFLDGQAHSFSLTSYYLLAWLRLWIISWGYNHCWYIEPRNREKSLRLIWQHFLCLLDEWIAKISKKNFFTVAFWDNPHYPFWDLRSEI